MKQIISILSLLLCMVSAQGEVLPADLFIHITSEGTYTMLADRYNNVGSGEQVAIAKDFYIGRYAVSNEQWREFIATTNRMAPGYWTDGEIPEGKEKHPVVWVSAEEAQAYCEWLQEQYPDYEFRLPTQGEWEYAAGGSQSTIYPWGNNAESTYADGVLKSHFNYNAVVGAYILQNPERLATFNNVKSTRYGEQEMVKNIFSINGEGSVSGWIDHTNYLGFVYTDIFTSINDGGGYTCAVNDYADGVSAWGCYNMSGNCWEWTSTVEEATNGAEKGQMVNMIKGGSWYATKGSCRISYRGEGRRASGRYATVGLRVVAEKRAASGIKGAVKVSAPHSAEYDISGSMANERLRGIVVQKGHKVQRYADATIF